MAITLFRRAASVKQIRTEIESKRALFALQTSDNGRVATETLDWVLSVFDKYATESESDLYGKYETWEAYKAARDAEEGFQREICKIIDGRPYFYHDTEILYRLRKAWEAKEKARAEWHSSVQRICTEDESKAWARLEAARKAWDEARDSFKSYAPASGQTKKTSP